MSSSRSGGFGTAEEATAWTWASANEQEGMLGRVRATQPDGFDLFVPVSGERSGLGLSSDTYSYARHWVVYVEMDDDTIWAAVVSLPDDLRENPTPALAIGIPDSARQVDPAERNRAEPPARGEP